MRGIRWRSVGGGLGLCLLVAALWRLAGTPPDSTGAPWRNYPRSHAPRARPFDAALREAVEWQQRAIDRATRNQEALKVWDPVADADLQPHPEQEWQQEVARDPGGYLHRALAQAERAASLARTRHEHCRAEALMAWLECSLGEHREELRQARQLVAWEPRNPVSLYRLRHAARCNGLKQLERQMDAALQALPP
jgi:hypothetical protein